MNNTAITEYCPECGDEFEMVCTTIWVNGKRLHEDCHRRATIAAKDAEIERLRTWLEVIRDSPELLVISERKAAALALSGNPAPQRREPNK